MAAMIDVAFFAPVVASRVGKTPVPALLSGTMTPGTQTE